MTYVSVFGLGVLTGFAVPYLWTWADWKMTRRRKFYE